MPEDYVRPPLVPRERSSAAVATWRFRVGALLTLVLLVVLVVVVFLHFSGVTAEDPGLGGGLRPPHGLTATAP